MCIYCKYDNQKKSLSAVSVSSWYKKNSQCYPLDKDRKQKDTQTTQTIQACTLTNDQNYYNIRVVKVVVRVLSILVQGKWDEMCRASNNSNGYAGMKRRGVKVVCVETIIAHIVLWDFFPSIHSIVSSAFSSQLHCNHTSSKGFPYVYSIMRCYVTECERVERRYAAEFTAI